MGERAGPFRFEVALSFAGDNKRDKVRRIAEILRERLGDGRVFFDEWFEHELAGHDAQVVLQSIYGKLTRLVVTCVCRRYSEKPWTQDEWRAIQSFERTIRDAGSGNLKRLRFLPLRFGDGEVDGLFDTAIVPDVRERTPENIAELIVKRLGAHRELPEVARYDEPRRSVGLRARINEGATQAKNEARALAWTISKHELTGIELVLIPAGTFKMGSPPGQGEENEEPQHDVRLSEFELGKYPVTREQYRRFLKASRKVKPPPFWDDRRFNQDRQPVVGVTWESARAYAEWAGLRLPTEAEWEYACRAGSKTKYCSGDTKDDLVQVGWFGSNSGGRLHEVGEKPPNAYGLCDLHGNVWEWCSDWYQSSYDPRASIDPLGPERGDDRVLRGGTWYDPAQLARSGYRLFHHPASVISSVGFRLARGPATGK